MDIPRKSGVFIPYRPGAQGFLHCDNPILFCNQKMEGIMASQIKKFIGADFYKTNRGDWTNRHWLLTDDFWQRFGVFRRKLLETAPHDTIHADTIHSELELADMEFELEKKARKKITLTDYDVNYNCVQYSMTTQDRVTLKIFGCKDNGYDCLDFQCRYIDYLERITKGGLRICVMLNTKEMRILDMFKLYDGDEYIGLITRVY
jgi:hypothetical protein